MIIVAGIMAQGAAIMVQKQGMVPVPTAPTASTILRPTNRRSGRAIRPTTPLKPA